MNKSVFASIVLRSAIVLVLPTQAAWAAGNNIAANHATAKANVGLSECVRAPNVGAFASDPYTVPPCLPRQRILMVGPGSLISQLGPRIPTLEVLAVDYDAAHALLAYLCEGDFLRGDRA